jgi:phenylpropionate dioxygenase-like ring-hydroxylating dioxygenase large terminal subunit
MIHLICDYQLVVDNLMDLTHETFVHGESIGNDAVTEAPFDVTHGDKTATVTRWMIDIEPPPFWRAQLGKPGNVDRWQIIRFEAPCTVAIDVGVAPTGTGASEGDRSHGVNGYVLNTISPETETSCHYFWAFARNYDLQSQQRTTELCEGVARIFRQDELVLTAQHRAIIEHPDHVFYNLSIDAGALWARRLIDRMPAAEQPDLDIAAE